MYENDFQNDACVILGQVLKICECNRVLNVVRKRVAKKCKNVRKQLTSVLRGDFNIVPKSSPGREFILLHAQHV